MNAVSEILQKFQNQKEITQHEMAKLLQISQATYWYTFTPLYTK
jgi:DNA-binding XRE family transcriptional regulator